MKKRPQSNLGSISTALIVLITLLAAASGSHAAADDKRKRAQHYEDLSLFAAVLELVRENYVEGVDEHDLLMSAMRGVLEDLDPHSSFMNPDVFDEMQVDTKGEFHGLGIEITKEPGTFIEVVSPIDGTPAKKAGILARDRISSICPTERPEGWTEECRSTSDMSLFEAISHMRGRRGTTITIYVIREGLATPRRFDIKRDTVKVASVRAKTLEPGYGYVKISSFQERTGADVRERLAELREENGGKDIAGLILDLRDNPGGLLNQAVEVADHWLSDGLVVYTQGRNEAERTEYGATSQTLESQYPIVVLVNEGSASASEIVAGALQDHHRAIVLGVGTFGKGSVQTIYPLVGGAGLRLTTALYYTPAGRSIQEVGITPDLVVSQADVATAGLPNRRRRMRERDLQGHFTQEDASGTESSSPPERLFDNGLGGDGAKGDAQDPDSGEKSESATAADGDAKKPAKDVQLARALEVLKSWNYFEDLRRLRGDSVASSADAIDSAFASSRTGASH